MDNFKIIDGKKYGWDGEDYEAGDAARENISKYKKDGFQTQLIEEEGKYLVYTRRMAAQAADDG